MLRRKRIRRSLMPTLADMEIDGNGVDATSGAYHKKPLTESKRDHGTTNIEQLTNQLEKITLKKLAHDAKKAKKPKYIDTSKLLRFSR